MIAKLILDILGSGVAAAVIVQMLKAHPGVPLEQGQTAKVRAVAALLSAAGVLLTSISQGIITEADVQSVITAAIAALAAWGVAHHAYIATKNG